MKDAETTMMPRQMRSLFVALLLSLCLSHPVEIWNMFKDSNERGLLASVLLKQANKYAVLEDCSMHKLFFNWPN